MWQTAAEHAHQIGFPALFQRLLFSPLSRILVLEAHRAIVWQQSTWIVAQTAGVLGTKEHNGYCAWFAPPHLTLSAQ